ncbi:MAG TPA: spermidine synthase [Myxococcales bacterium]|nr:spermidine synthase [Myxococcales bacterium]
MSEAVGRRAQGAENRDYTRHPPLSLSRPPVLYSTASAKKEISLSPLFEILDHQDTPLGELCLRRRELLSRPGVIITEVTLDQGFLMSSYHTESERRLAEFGLGLHPGDELSVLVGGLGLGYTAEAALASDRVARVEVLELLEPVIAWLERGWLPTGDALASDKRLEVSQGDVYARLLGPPRQTVDVILIDVDHAPDEPLDSASAAFYTREGLAAVAEHLNPGGVLGVWSTDPSPAFEATLAAVFECVEVEVVHWWNDLIDVDKEDTLFAARKAG